MKSDLTSAQQEQAGSANVTGVLRELGKELIETKETIFKLEFAVKWAADYVSGLKSSIKTLQQETDSVQVASMIMLDLQTMASFVVLLHLENIQVIHLPL